MFLRKFASHRILIPLSVVDGGAGFSLIPFPPVRAYGIAILIASLGIWMAALQRLGAAERKAAEAARQERQADVFMALEAANIEQAMSNEKLAGILAETVSNLVSQPGLRDTAGHRILRLIQGTDQSGLA